MWRLKIAEGGGPWLRSLNNFGGRQVWEYDEQGGDAGERVAVDKARSTFTENRYEQRHSSDLLMRLQFAKENPLPELPAQLKIENQGDLTEEAVTTTLRRSLRFYSTIQAHDGHWPGDYGGPMFLMPGLVIALYVTGSLNTVLTPAHQKEMRRYLYNHQNKDGGWGLHIEGHSTMFGSVLSYVTLRILGDGPDGGDFNAVERGRNWIQEHGGATYITSWGKFWLSVLGVFEWSGNNPLPPEIWMLPYFVPLHPGRMWCHCRMVYLPMSFIYGKRFTGKITELVKELRQELFVQKYSEINWNEARNLCAKEDLYYPHPWVQDVLWGTLHKVVEPVLTRWPGSLFRKKALAHTMEHIHYEDENTRYLDIGPVNKVMNMLSCWIENPNSEAFKLHLARVVDYLWMAEDGMKMQGYNGSQLWDTSFAVQALAATNLPDDCGSMLKKANSYIDNNQVREDSPGDMAYWYRHISKGAWPFSSRDHGWPISDCSSEGLKATLILADFPKELVGDALSADRLYDAVNVILSYQNADGGSATYENTRSYPWLEYINPAETFGDIVIDYSYVECTSACIQALAAFQKKYPHHRTKEIASSIQRARKYIESIQKDDGSWYGSWAVCFTYAMWFGVLGLIAAGQTYETSFHIRMACKFLLSKQLPDGGWGESYLSCQDKVYSNLPRGKSHIVNTSWAMLTLMAAGQWDRNPEPLHKAATSLINQQMESGDFPQQEIMGVFNRNCMISYSAYRCIFPIWALGEYRQRLMA
ncbi:hypothetical protein KC19_N011500 [Ceratodon purpureus]|nr:hypothetical protein KC19_N011500 [Ceratodon purpureus]